MKFFKYLIEAFIIYLLFLLFRVFGIEFSRKFSSFLLSKFGFFFRRKKIIKNNILKVFKDYSNHEIDKLIEKMWSNYGLTFAEYVFLDKFRFNVSLFSSNESSNTATLISPVVSPAAIVKVPDVAV